MFRLLRFVLVAALTSALVTWSLALDVSGRAVDNATVQPAGPRPGTSGKQFFNVEGNNYGQFASFGVLDFDSTLLRDSNNNPIPFNVTGITAISLTLYDRPASFSRPGPINIWLVTDTTTDIQPGTSPLRWDPNDLPNGLGSQFSTRFLLGTGTYNTPGTRGTPLTYNLSLDPTAANYLMGQINSHDKVRLVVTPADNATAATYSGFTDTPPPPSTIPVAPQINLSLVPEPASLIALGIGLVGLAARRRKK